MVGASILNVITESLYDNPIVVFREYVQNSVDAIYKSENKDAKKIKIWVEEDNLFFLDNGTGICSSDFQKKMISIGASSKRKRYDLGYKGIGRLSGVPYCQDLYFINICDFSSSQYQTYKISGEDYLTVKKSDEYEECDFETLMTKIGDYHDGLVGDFENYVFDAINRNSDMFMESRTGFLVVLSGMKKVLNDIVSSEGFLNKLSWLLPVDFQEELNTSEIADLLSTLKERDESFRICNIYFNDIPIRRPIDRGMLRDHSCMNDFECAQGFYTFNGSKIEIDGTNSFSGIRIYIDNMLLCDETELIQNLANYHLLSHTVNGSLQAVKGIGAMIFISDKVNISANARRTFIEVTDQTSFEFLRKLSDFVDLIYDARYALSNYVSARRKNDSPEKVGTLKNKALEALRELAKDNVELTKENENDFEALTLTDKKRVLKKLISSQLDSELKRYLKQLEIVNKDNAYEDFIDWLLKQ